MEEGGCICLITKSKFCKKKKKISKTQVKKKNAIYSHLS